jgi:hypothetical protein
MSKPPYIFQQQELALNTYLKQQEKIIKRSRTLRRQKKWEELFDHWSKTEFSFKLLALKNKKPISLYQEIELSCSNEIQKLKAEVKKPKGNKFFDQGVFKSSVEHFWLQNQRGFSLKSWDHKNSHSQIQDLDQALSFIKTYLPSDFIRILKYSHTFIPIKDITLVSYSFQFLPGYSFINFYHRDELDLIDDIIHENGHHHLNSYLRKKSLFNETSERLFFSPWRRSWRPLRGLYHAYFTFFWGYELFFQLQQLFLEKKSELPSWILKYQKKIIRRYHQEKIMLDISYGSLRNAYKAGLIYSDGWEIIQNLHKIMESRAKYHKKMNQLLTPQQRKYFKKMRQDIGEFKTVRTG